MTYEDIDAMWKDDCEIDIADLGRESVKTPKLHNKYYRLYVENGLKLRKLKTDMSKLRKLKTEYYLGQLDIEDLREYGWEPQPLKILKQDIPTYIEADTDIINLSLRVGLVQENVQYLESILKEISSRQWTIRNAIEWEKFRTGAV